MPANGFVRWRRGRREVRGRGEQGGGSRKLRGPRGRGSWPSHGSVGTLAVLLELRPCPVQQRQDARAEEGGEDEEGVEPPVVEVVLQVRAEHLGEDAAVLQREVHADEHHHGGEVHAHDLGRVLSPWLRKRQCYYFYN